MDLGFMGVQDRLGRSIFLYIVDEFTLAEWVHFLKRKNDALDEWRRWLDQASRGFGISKVVLPFLNPQEIGAVRTDNGGEFGADFVEDIQRRGIQVERSTPVEGHVFLAERGIRSAKELTRRLLFNANMP